MCGDSLQNDLATTTQQLKNNKCVIKDVTQNNVKTQVQKDFLQLVMVMIWREQITSSLYCRLQVKVADTINKNVNNQTSLLDGIQLKN